MGIELHRELSTCLLARRFDDVDEVLRVEHGVLVKDPGTHSFDLPAHLFGPFQPDIAHLATFIHQSSPQRTKRHGLPTISFLGSVTGSGAPVIFH